MDLGLAGKRALVLASSRGLGLGIATALVAEGAHVVITGRSAEKLTASAEALTASGPGRADAVACDFAAEGAVETIATAALARLGGVDILVNNTGGPPPGSIFSFAPDLWEAQFAVMVRNIFDITARLVPAMRQRGFGRVLTIASAGVEQPIPGLGISNALRAALAGWSKTLAEEVARDGVTANVLLPGRIQTERVDELDRANAAKSGRTVEEVVAASRASIPIGRNGRVEEFAAVAAFLVSERASYMTGSLVRCDGGMIRSI